jgi:branched-chain amino acid transport system substrate-binding protein
MSRRTIVALAVSAATVLTAGGAITGQAFAAQNVKIGLILPYTGVGTLQAQQMDRGVEQYLKMNAAQLKRYTFTIIRRDSKAPNGAAAKEDSQELLTQETVDVLAGWNYSPDAIASAPVITAGKRLAVIMNAGTAFITNLSPYFVRVSFTLWQSSYVMGEQAAKYLHAKTAVIAYTDYPPGKDALNAFTYAFEHNGGKVVDAIPAGGPTATPDFTPFFQRAKNEHPDVLFVFVPGGDQATAVVKTYAALGMRAAGIKLIGTGDVVPDTELQGMGNDAVGLITTYHYNADLPNSANKALVKAWKAAYGPDSTPDFTSIGGYDGMAAIVHALEATRGNIDDVEAAVRSLEGWKFDSPRGPIEIDPQTRDIIMNEYLQEVVRGSDGKLHEKVLATFNNVKDQCKDLAIGACAPKK